MIETNTETWESVLAFIDNELNHANNKLDNMYTSHEETMYYRGAKAMLIKLASLPEKQPIETIYNTGIYE